LQRIFFKLDFLDWKGQRLDGGPKPELEKGLKAYMANGQDQQ